MNLKSGELKSKKKNKEKLNLSPIKTTKVEENKEQESFTDIINKETKLADEISDVTLKNSANVMGVSSNIKNSEINSLEDLLGALGDIEKDFEGVKDRDYYEDRLPDIPDSLNLEKMEVPTIDKNKITEDVTTSLTKETEKEKQELEQKSEDKKQLKEAEIEELKKMGDTKKEEISKIYDDYKTSAESDAIKRGLARSSVAILTMDNIEASKAKELSKLAEDLTTSINAVETEIIGLQEELDSSLNNLDLELAVKINNQIEKKIEELEEKRTEAIDFNNKVNKMEAEYQLKLTDKLNDAAELEAKLKAEYEGYAENDKREQKLQTAISYFSKMHKTDALRVIINSPELATSLGDGYYDLYYYIMRK